MTGIDLIYNMWIKTLASEYNAPHPDINNENHIFELGKILNQMHIDPFEIDQIIENVKNTNKIVRLDEARERKVPPGHILVKNKKSGYLYVILKSTYNDNPERYSLPSQQEKIEWESGVEDPEVKPDDELVTTPKVVQKARIKADPADINIKLQGDVEDEEPQNAVEEPSDSGSIFDYGVDGEHFNDKSRLKKQDDFNSNVKKLKLEPPKTLDPYRLPEDIKQNALVPVIYLELIERIINTYNKEQAAELGFYVTNLNISGNLMDQLGQLISSVTLTLSDEVSSYFIEDLKSYSQYLTQYDKANETNFSEHTVLNLEWIKEAEKTRKKMLNFLSKKFDSEFFIIAATSSDKNDVKALNVGAKKDSKIGDVNVKVNVNDKNYWLRIKLEAPETESNEDDNSTQNTDSSNLESETDE